MNDVILLVDWGRASGAAWVAKGLCVLQHAEAPPSKPRVKNESMP